MFSWISCSIFWKLHELHKDLLFLPERMKIEEVKKLVTNIHDETEYVIHIRNLKQALNHALVLKNVHRAWLSLTKAIYWYEQ